LRCPKQPPTPLPTRSNNTRQLANQTPPCQASPVPHKCNEDLPGGFQQRQSPTSLEATRWDQPHQLANYFFNARNLGGVLAKNTAKDVIKLIGTLVSEYVQGNHLVAGDCLPMQNGFWIGGQAGMLLVYSSRELWREEGVYYRKRECV